MNILLRILTWSIRHDAEEIVKRLQRNVDAAPTCCDTPMEYISEHSGFRVTTQFYQCAKCKKVGIQHARDWEKK